VKLSVADKAAVHFHGRPGGVVSTPHEVADAITKLIYRYELEEETKTVKHQFPQTLKPTSKARKKKSRKVATKSRRSSR
jgi:hypothetical protein